MTTMTFVRAALIAATLAAGCGGEMAGMIEADAGDGTGGAAGGPTATGGQTGAGTGGTTGAGGALPDPGPNSLGRVTFRRSDHDLCMLWPVCPPDIKGVAAFYMEEVRPETCRFAFDGVRMNCGQCYGTNGAFVGRCIAPRYSAGEPAGGWMLCTGLEYQPSFDLAPEDLNKTNAQLVCEG